MTAMKCACFVNVWACYGGVPVLLTRRLALPTAEALHRIPLALTFAVNPYSVLCELGAKHPRMCLQDKPVLSHSTSRCQLQDMPIQGAVTVAAFSDMTLVSLFPIQETRRVYVCGVWMNLGPSWRSKKYAFATLRLRCASLPPRSPTHAIAKCGYSHDNHIM